MEIKKSAVMAAVETRAKALDKFIGETVSVRNLQGTLRHLFTGDLFHRGVETDATFDGFLRGQALAGRVVVSKDGKPLVAAPVEIKAQAEGSGVTSGGDKPDVESLVKVTAPETTGDDAPTAEPVPQDAAPAAEPVPQDAAPAAKTSILKKPAA